MAERHLNFNQALNEARRQEMQRDPTFILLGEDVAGGADVEHLHGEDAWGGMLSVTKGLVQEFGRDRILDTPISESGFIGAAATGLRPIAEMMFVGFMGVCFGQILNQGAKLRYMFGGKAEVPLVSSAPSAAAAFGPRPSTPKSCIRCSPIFQASKRWCRPRPTTPKGC